MVANYAVKTLSEQPVHDVSCLEKIDLSSCHVSCHDSCNEGITTLSCHDHVMYDVKKKLPMSDYNYLVNQLEAWRVFAPRAVIKRYGALNAWEAMNRTKDFKARIPGAYFTKVIRSLTGMNGKLQAAKKAEQESVSLIDAFKDYKNAMKYLNSITGKDLEDPQTAMNVNNLKIKFNFA